MPEARIGCSGFNYRDWKGTFYPLVLAQKSWFKYYCKVFSTVELNVTFYRLPRPATLEKWYDKTPPGFVFSIKGSRYITHVKKLLDPEEPLARFFESALHLKEKLKLVLWQFPPQFGIHTDRLGPFLEALRPYPVRSTFEFRHESWITEEVIALLQTSNAGLCLADWPHFIDDLPVTADFVYMRRHGEGGRYATCYSTGEVRKDSKRIREYLKTGKDVFIYFNNSYHGYAPKNAGELKGILVTAAGPPRHLRLT